LAKAEKLFSAIKTEDPDWYEEKIGERVEKRLFKKVLGTVKVEREEVAPPLPKATPTGFTPTTNDEVEEFGTVEGSRATDTPYNDEIKEIFGEDLWREATIVLKRKNKDGQVVGENVQLLSGPEVDVVNRIDPETGEWDPNAPPVIYKNKWTGEEEQSTDRGLFRINNKGLYEKNGKLDSPLFRGALIELGLLDEKYRDWKNVDKEAIDDLWEKMLNVEDNIKMAKAIYDYNGWSGWLAAPKEWQ